MTLATLHPVPSQVGRPLAVDEPSTEKEVDDGAQEETAVEGKGKAKASSSVIKVLHKLSSPIRKLGKRKPTELSPGSLPEREEGSSSRSRARESSPTAAQEVTIASAPPSSFTSDMPPPSVIPSASSNPFYVRHLEQKLRESQEDLAIMDRRLRESREDIGTLMQRHASRESLLMEEIEYLRGNYGEGSSRQGSGAGSSSSRRR
jgi:hypothetical protein